jgi:hypothetical protein
MQNLLKSTYLRKISFSIISVLLLFPVSGYTQLTGDVYIGSGETYTTITDAVNALNSSGFSGHLKFIVKDGTYNEQVEINEFANSDENNTITFTSQSGDSTAVILTYESGSINNYIIRLNGTDYITFEKLTIWGLHTSYTHAIDITGTAQNITVRNCELRSNGASNAGSQNPALIHHYRANITDVTITNNLIIGGMGVYFESLVGSPAQGVSTLNNHFKDGHGCVYLEQNNSPKIISNVVENNSRGAFTLDHCDGEIVVMNNKIEADQSNALTFTYCNGGAPPLGTPGNITNNFITVHGEVNGIYVNQSTYLNIFHNSVNSLGTTAISPKSLNVVGGSNNIIKNNIFANQHNGYACFINSPGTGTEINYNNYYSPANFPFYWNENLVSLSEFQTAGGMDSHSQDVYPNFISDLNLHTSAPWLDGKGEYNSDFPEDIDGVSRSDPPDIGAAEFTPLAGATTPLSGSYEIGSTPYQDFSNALADLLLKGVSGPVVFDVANGNYNEQLIIRDIPGASDQNTITFRSHSGDPDDVVIYYHDAGTNDNYVILMKGADYWRFENLTFRANTSASASYGRVFHLFAGTDNFVLSNCLLIGSPVNNSAADALAVVYSRHSVYKSRVFKNNLFQHGSYGYFDENHHSFPLLQGLELTDNEFKESYNALFLDYHEAPKVTGNYIHETDGMGIHLAHASGEIEILSNQVLVNSSSALYLESCDGSGDRGLVANNFIHSGGTSTAHGMRVYNTNNFDFYYNSVSVTSTHTTAGRTLYLTVGQNLNFINNIFSNSGGGLVYYIDSPSAINSTDYNDLYATGAILANWNGDQADLAVLQSASGMEANSISANPQFVSQTDLHASAAEVDGAAQHLAAVPTDIDGQPRHPSTPDIGADEFMFGPNNPPIVASHITDVDYLEDSGPHTRVVDLNTIFSDPDPGDYLIFSAQSDNQAIAATINSPALEIHSQANYFGSANIIVTATDFAANTVQDTFLVTFTPVNDPPAAVDDITSSGANHAFTISVLANDYDVDGDAITITSISQGQHGSTVIDSGDSTITYTPQNGYFGADSFTYDIGDGNGGSDQAKVYLTITSLFTLVDVNIPDISHGLGMWVDYDMDGDLDILLAGDDQSTNKLLRIYRNNSGSFFLISNLSGISPGNSNAAAWGDFDNDGDPDLLVTGYEDNSSRATKLYRNDINTFTEITTGILGVSDAAVDWGDYDNDGDLDILLTGLDGSANEMAKIYMNAGPGPGNNWIFIGLNISLVGVQKGTALWGDYDNDMDLDILISGQANNRILRIFKNDNGTFTDANAGLTPVAGGAAWGDYDNDGDLDILVNGINESLDEQCDIYQNTNGVFSNINAGIPGLSKGSAVWGDYDNDGDLDICLTGTNSLNEPTTKLYDNMGSNTFNEASVALPGIVYSSANWGDFDNDGRLDLLLTGYQYVEPNVFTAVYKNAIPTVNTPPNPPLLGSPQVTETSVTLNWGLASDNQTSSTGLSYNLRVGEISGGSQILSAISNANGYRQIVDIGNTCMDTSWTINGLTSGRMYYWSVQAIDGAYAGSDFAEGYFTTISPYVEEVFSGIPGMMNGTAAWGDYDNDGDLDVITAGEIKESDYARKTGLFENESGAFSEVEHSLPDLSRATLLWGDYDNDGDLDLYAAGEPNVYPEINSIYENNSGSFSDIDANFGTLNDKRIYDADWGDFDNDGDLDIIICGHDNNPVTKIFMNTAGIFSEVNATLISESHSTVTWVDYDTDGDLDIFINGYNARIFRNDNGSFTNSNISISGTSYGSIDCGDYDSDGDPDLLITGIGIVNEAMAPVTKLYRNDVSDNGTFTDATADIQNITYGNATWGDFDNDGDLDILMTGNSEFGATNEPYTAIYINTDNTFAALDVYLPPLMTANARWADFDNDFDLDFLLMGVDESLDYFTKLFKNKVETPNSVPSSPNNLTAEANENSLIFHWSNSSDNQTDSEGLSYNLRIGTTPGGSEIKSAMSDSSGYRKIVKTGNVAMDTTWFLSSYDPGIFYYWSVQTIDNNFSGSKFANEHSFYSIAELEGVLVVTNNNNSGEGSLRQAILDANSLAGPDTIVFAPNVRGSIVLESWLPSINESVSILGPGARLLAIDGNQQQRLLWSDSQHFVTINVKDLTFQNGYSTFSGVGISGYQDTLIISSCIISNNVSTGTAAGIGNTEGKTAIYNSTIDNNRATGGAGGLSSQGGKLWMFGCTISNNSVDTDPVSGGGGIAAGGEIELINCTVSGNHHSLRGGGIYIYGLTSTLKLKYVTITGNSSGDGGGISTTEISSLSASHTIIAGNSAESNSPDLAATLYSEGYNLIESTDGATITGDLTGNILDTDPMLFSLTSNGGPTKTHALQTGSPAIDAGKPGPGIPNDQRGIQRPQDGTGDGQSIHDIGAVEIMQDGDNDGMPDVSEWGPDGDDLDYDGNGDLIPDDEQDDVSSFWDYARTTYITLEASDGSNLQAVRLDPDPSSEDDSSSGEDMVCIIPIGGPLIPVCFPESWVSWEGIPSGRKYAKEANISTAFTTSYRLFLPEGTHPDTYLMYGPTPNMPYDHYYKFMYDGKTGAVISGDTITLHLIDGQRGDGDLTANGEIKVSFCTYGFLATAICAEQEIIPDQYDLLQNYPNPFNPVTTIPFNLPHQSDVLLTVYNILGQKVITLIDDNLPAGRYQHNWSIKSLASGIYFYRLEANKFVRTRKLIILK